MELRLMVVTEPTSSAITADGRHWRLSEPLDIKEGSKTLPPYACASYVWGSGREPNAIHPSIMMSDRTLATFAAVARHARVEAIWIDAFCVPTEPFARRMTLESLGFIFARAACVVAVIASESLDAVREMQKYLERGRRADPASGEISTRPLEMLDADKWIRSVWTYQEVVNGPEDLLFVSTTKTEDSIHGQMMLNAVGGYLTAHGNSSDKPFHWLTISYRHVLDFEQLLADWFMSEYTGRSAYLIMSGLAFRTYAAPANYFYSMIGALTSKPSSRAINPTVEGLAERFMELCEEKGDYSFIFSSVPRDTRPGMRWRPSPGILKSVLTWHSFGSGQPGIKMDGGVLLRDVVVFTPVSPEKSNFDAWGVKGKTVIEHWMRFPPKDEDRVTLVHRALTEAMGFTGTGGWFVTDGGVFYAQEPLPDGETVILVSRGVRWVFGAPGIAIVVVGDDWGPVYTPGVFVGEVDTGSVSELLLS